MGAGRPRPDAVDLSGLARGPLRLEELVAAALAEDLGERGDITSDLLIPAGMAAVADVVPRQYGTLAGRAPADEVARQMGLSIAWSAADGDRVAPRAAVARVSGPARALLSAERTLLNFLTRLSGIATLASAYAEAAAPALALDTRKTTPGWRALEKAAVAAGGAANHRIGLHDRVLVKDNHLALAGAGLVDAVARARAELPGVLVEVEADDLDGVRLGLEAGADWILLDNMDASEMRAAVDLVAGRAKTEASGRMGLERAREAAACGVDAVSVGALTHSAPALDLGLDLVV